MTYLLDTNTCIRYLNGTSENVRQRMEASSPEEIVLCSVVKAELIYGAFKGVRSKANLERLELFSSRFDSLPFDDEAAWRYGEIRADLERRGTVIGPNDLMIAAIGLAKEAVVVTNNQDEFSRVRGLALEDWI